MVCIWIIWCLVSPGRRWRKASRSCQPVTCAMWCSRCAAVGSQTSTNSISFRVSHCMLQIVELEGFADKNSKDDMFSIVFLVCYESAILYHNTVVLICTRSCTSYGWISCEYHVKNLVNFYDLILFQTHRGLSLVSARHRRRAQFPHHILSAWPCNRPCSWRRNLRCNLQCERLVCCKMQFQSCFPIFLITFNDQFSSTIVEDQACDMQNLIESVGFGHQVTPLDNLSTVLRWDPWLYLHDLWCKWGHVTMWHCAFLFRFKVPFFSSCQADAAAATHAGTQIWRLEIRGSVAIRGKKGPARMRGLLLGFLLPDSLPQALISPRFVGPGPQMQMQTPQTMQMRPAMPRWERQNRQIQRCKIRGFH